MQELANIQSRRRRIKEKERELESEYFTLIQNIFNLTTKLQGFCTISGTFWMKVVFSCEVLYLCNLIKLNNGKHTVESFARLVIFFQFLSSLENHILCDSSNLVSMLFKKQMQQKYNAWCIYNNNIIQHLAYFRVPIFRKVIKIAIPETFAIF